MDRWERKLIPIIHEKPFEIYILILQSVIALDGILIMVFSLMPHVQEFYTMHSYSEIQNQISK